MGVFTTLNFVSFILKNKTDEERVESELITNKLNYVFGSDTVEITKAKDETIVEVKDTFGNIVFSSGEFNITRSNDNGATRYSVPIKMLEAVLRLWIR